MDIRMCNNNIRKINMCKFKFKAHEKGKKNKQNPPPNKNL